MISEGSNRSVTIDLVIGLIVAIVNLRPAGPPEVRTVAEDTCIAAEVCQPVGRGRSSTAGRRNETLTIPRLWQKR